MGKIKELLNDPCALRVAIGYPITISLDCDGNVTGYREQVIDTCPQCNIDNVRLFEDSESACVDIYCSSCGCHSMSGRN